MFCPSQDSQSQSGICGNTYGANWSATWVGKMLLELSQNPSAVTLCLGNHISCSVDMRAQFFAASFGPQVSVVNESSVASQSMQAKSSMV